jgi:hypothetical protein
MEPPLYLSNKKKNKDDNDKQTLADRQDQHGADMHRRFIFSPSERQNPYI